MNNGRGAQSREKTTGDRPHGCFKAVLGAVFFSLVAFVTFTLPDHADAFSPSAFARLPLEWPILALLLLFTPGRFRRPAIFFSGFLILLILFLKVADIGVETAFQRAFNPYLDMKMLADGWNLIAGTIGTVKAVVVVVTAVFCVLLMVVLFLKAARWMTAPSGSCRTALVGFFSAVSLVGMVLFAQGRQAVDFHIPEYLTERLALIIRSVEDMKAFEAELVSGVGPRNGEGLFQAVKGKDIVLVFFESYGRSALEDARYSTVTLPRLDAIERQIAASGLKSASGWVTSPTVGGISWLAHGTLLSGLWIDSQARYDRLMISKQPALNRLFSQTGWQSVAVMPAITMAWPEARYFGYDQTLAAADLQYRGKPFDWVTMPDQYTLSAFQRLAVEPAHARGKNVMAEIALISSHAPWTPVAKLVPWESVGDGSVFNEQATSGDPPTVVWSDPERVRSQYIQTIDYTLATLGSYMERYGRNSVFVILGDHQPASIITGPNASRAVPVHIVTDDAALLTRFQAAGFTPGMTPNASSKEWRMDDLRQVLITLFGGGGVASEMLKSRR